jgi:hypothetical protein
MNLMGVSCTDTSHCWAAGQKGVVIVTSNGGTTWTSETTGDMANDFNAIACGDSSHCWATDNKGNVYGTSNGGTTWALVDATAAPNLRAATAPSAGRVYVAGDMGDIYVLAQACSSGGLMVTSPSSITLPGVTLNGLDQTVSTTGVFTPDDESSALAGWNLTGTSTTFTNGAGKTLPTTATAVTAGSAAKAAGTCSLPSNGIGYPVTLPAAASAPTPAKLYDAATSTGVGPSTVTLTFALTVPANALTGTYSSTWTFTGASGP